MTPPGYINHRLPRRDEFLTDVANGMAVEDLMRKWTFGPSLKQKVRGKLSGLKHKLLG